MEVSEVERLIKLMSRLPGLGPRSARRAVLHLVKRRDSQLAPLLESMQRVADTVATCSVCGNIDSQDPCSICRDSRRDHSTICVVEDVGDLWALERTATYRGLYHVLGGVLSALEGVGPEDLRIDRLLQRAHQDKVEEVILATSATVDGQTTAHYIAERLRDRPVNVTRLAHGVPVGADLDHLDDGTISQALRARSGLGAR